MSVTFFLLSLYHQHFTSICQNPKSRKVAIEIRPIIRFPEKTDFVGLCLRARLNNCLPKLHASRTLSRTQSNIFPSVQTKRLLKRMRALTMGVGDVYNSPQQRVVRLEKVGLNRRLGQVPTCVDKTSTEKREALLFI